MYYPFESLYTQFVSVCNKYFFCDSDLSENRLSCLFVLSVNVCTVSPAGQAGYYRNNHDVKLSVCLSQTCWGQSVSSQTAVVLLRSLQPTPTATSRSVCVFYSKSFLPVSQLRAPTFMLFELTHMSPVRAYLTRRRNIPAEKSHVNRKKKLFHNV